MFRVNSEIGRLKKVLLHRPGKELDNLVPNSLEQLLFDDIPWLDLARKEHDDFADIFRNNGIEVLYLEDLVSEALDTNSKIKDLFIEEFINEAEVFGSSIKEALKDYLNSFDKTVDMVLQTMAGIKKTELPKYSRKNLIDYIDDYPFVTDPMPNLYYTRDPFSVIGNGVTINKMYSTTRRREGIYGQFIFKYHPEYGNDRIPIYYNRDNNPTLEGGDIIVLSDEILAIGISQRTHASAIEKLAKTLLYNESTSFEKILAFNIPKTRAYMHLDTVFTQVDFDLFTIHHDLKNKMDVYELSKSSKGGIKIKHLEKKLEDILSYYLGHLVRLIPCGGTDKIAGAREQWNDGANTLAIAPGEVIVYDRNHITNSILEKAGVKLNKMASSELGRGRGGPRCMSMAFMREEIKK